MEQALGYVVFVALNMPDLEHMHSAENHDTNQVYTVLHLVTKLFSLQRGYNTFVILTKTSCNNYSVLPRPAPQASKWQHIGDTAAYLKATSLNRTTTSDA